MKPLYSFGLISDVHIDEENWGTAPNGWWKFSEQHFEQCLKYNTDKKVDFIVSAGDQVTNAKYYNLDKEWKAYHYIFSQSEYCNPIYESCGNHELRESGAIEAQLEKFIFETGLTSELDSIKKRKAYFSFTEPRTGDLFIMMALEKGYQTADYDEFSDEQLDFVERLLEENYKKNINIFLVQHALIKGYGVGDDVNKQYYKGAANPELSSTKRFIGLLEKYRNVVWISGHSHLDFAEGFNYADYEEKSCRMIHVSSVANPNHIVNGEIDYTFDEALSQGYLVNVFPDEIEFIPVNYCTGMNYEKMIIRIKGETHIRNSIKEIEVDENSIVSVSELESAIKNANTFLGVNYEYSSYNQYQHLKKIYKKYKGMNFDLISQTDINKAFILIKSAIEALNKIITDIRDIRCLNLKK